MAARGVARADRELRQGHPVPLRSQRPRPDHRRLRVRRRPVGLLRLRRVPVPRARLRRRSATSSRDSGAAWPFRYDDLEPYYGEAERLLGIAGDDAGDPTAPRRSSPYPFPPAPLAPITRRVVETAADLGLSPFHLPLAINHAALGDPPRVHRVPHVRHLRVRDRGEERRRDDDDRAARRARPDAVAAHRRAPARGARAARRAGSTSCARTTGERDGDRRATASSSPPARSARRTSCSRRGSTSCRRRAPRSAAT